MSTLRTNTVTNLAGTGAPDFPNGVSVSNGTAAAPSITNTSDTNTGIYFPAADTIAFVEGGTEALRLASAGQIGIGGANYGTAGQVLTSGGPSAAPSWAASPAPTSAQVGTATAGLTAGAVGTYAFCAHTTANISWALGDAIAGSSLRATTVSSTGTLTSSSIVSGSTGSAPAGTWIALSAQFAATNYTPRGLFLRIS
jgi:hypothetical protein